MTSRGGRGKRTKLHMTTNKSASYGESFGMRSKSAILRRLVDEGQVTQRTPLGETLCLYICQMNRSRISPRLNTSILRHTVRGAKGVLLDKESIYMGKLGQGAAGGARVASPVDGHHGDRHSSYDHQQVHECG